MRRVVCAANRSNQGTLIVGVRHWDFLMCYQAEVIGHHMKFTEQGFIDNQGMYLSREEAWLIAEAAGQIVKRVGGDMDAEGVGKLYSENLY